MTQGLMKSCVAQRTGHQIPCDFFTPVKGFALLQWFSQHQLVNHLDRWACPRAVWFRRGVADAGPGTPL